MTSINPEMLKQLLSEFEEKEAVCVEEINAITEQITELEKRITSSKERLGSVARDREKIGLMKQRYAEGDWSSVLSQLPKPNGNGTKAVDVTRTGDVPPVVMPSVPAPEPLPAQPAAAVEPEPAPAPAPVVAPEPAPVVAPPEVAAPAMTAPQASVPNPFDAPPVAPAQQSFQMEAPSWEQPQPFTEAPPPQPAMPEPAPAAAPPSGGLFPFSGQPQAAEGADGADIPWAPPPSMSWESVGGTTFPNQNAAPDPTQGFQTIPPQQQQAQPSPPFGDPNAFGAPQPQPAPFGAPAGMDFGQAPPAGFGDPSGMQQQQQQAPPQGFMSTPPAPPSGNQQSVLSSAFDEEFDISDALRGEDESNSQDPRDSDKKIKDALRGLFS